MRSLLDFPLDDDSIGGVDRPEPRVRLTDVCITAWGMREDWLDTRDFREVVCGYTRDNSKACCIRLHARGRAADAAQITLGDLGQLGSATGGTSMSRTLVGMIHGRFQPFHNGHLDCLTWLAANADRMIVGITNPDWRDVSPVRHAPHRHLDSENPYPYHLREEMVRGAARDAGLEDRRLRVIPFFLNSPEVWSAYFTRDCVPSIGWYLRPLLTSSGADHGREVKRDNVSFNEGHPHGDDAQEPRRAIAAWRCALRDVHAGAIIDPEAIPGGRDDHSERLLPAGDEAAEMLALVRRTTEQAREASTADISSLFGGSVSLMTTDEYFATDNGDGAVVGGVSRSANSTAEVFRVASWAWG